MVCDSCGSQRNALTTKRSDLYSQMVFNFCTSCVEGNMEPRWLVILAARAGKDVASLISDRRYIGEDILGKDLE